MACVDVNYGQLAWKIRQDERVAVFERTNIKTADPVELGAPFDLIVIDVSFIGLAALAETFPPLCREPALCAQGVASGSQVASSAMGEANPTVFIGLVKPQFESRHDETDHGVVRDEAVRLRTVEEVRSALEEVGFAVTGVVESPITGPEGNVEYLVRAEFRG